MRLGSKVRLKGTNDGFHQIDLAKEADVTIVHENDKINRESRSTANDRENILSWIQGYNQGKAVGLKILVTL